MSGSRSYRISRGLLALKHLIIEPSRPSSQTGFPETVIRLPREVGLLAKKEVDRS